jgi:hypothetical protein
MGNQLRGVSVTKSLAAAEAYAAEDVMSESVSAGTGWTFSQVVPSGSTSGYIVKAQILCQTTNITPRLTLYLFTPAPSTTKNDNVANKAVADIDAGNYVGRIDFPAMTDLGGDSETVVTPSTSGNLPLAFSCANGDNSLSGILVTQDAVTITATNNMTVTLIVEPV